MSTSKAPKIVQLAELQPGEAGMFFARLVERNRNLTAAKKPFYSCRFRDRRRTVSTVFWGDGELFQECETWPVGGYFKIQATFSIHDRYGPQIDISKIRAVEDRDKADGFDPADFQEQSRFDPATMLAELQTLVTANIADEPLRKLTLGLLEQHAETLKKLPATTNRFYPFPGGWLEHVLNVMKNVLWLTDRYRDHYTELKPPLNKDVLVAGTALHEIGAVLGITIPDAVDELADFSTDGRLLGPHILTRDVVRDACRAQGDITPELQRLLEHLLLSYLNLPEWGSPRLPMIPEALVLHHADDLDAKLEMYARHLQADASPNDFTERDAVLRQPLYKGRTV